MHCYPTLQYKQQNVRLDVGSINFLDEFSKYSRISKTDIIRSLIHRFQGVHADQGLDAALRYVLHRDSEPLL